jgi:hypothetical protein
VEKRDPTMPADRGRESRPPWLLALACALIPAGAIGCAWWLSVRAGHIPDCIPHLEGCTSISRAARHGTGNVVFKVAMIPCAFLQGWLWVVAGRWLRARHPAPGAGSSLAALGVVAGIALALYATFLGTDGAIYQWLRRFGIVFYFGSTYLAMIAFTQRLIELRLERPVARLMLALCSVLLALGLANVAARGLVADPALKDRIEDMLEWHLATLLVAWMLTLAFLWRREGR